MPHDMRRTPSQASLPPAPPYYSSQAPTSARKADRADTIIQNFYSKVAQVITQARLIQYDGLSGGNIPPNTNLTTNLRQAQTSQRKSNRWFNLEMWDSDSYKEDLRYWRHTATSTGLPPNPMIIEFFLDTSELPKNKILVITDDVLRRHKVDAHISGNNEDGESKNILLESWKLTLSHSATDQSYPPPDLPVVYKKSIAFFRSLYAYVRLLPAFRLFKRIKTKLNHDLKIGYRFVLPNAEYVDDIGIDVPIIEGKTSNVSSQFTFGSIETPLGMLSLKVNYRTDCEFHVDESEEEILSSNFMVNFTVDFDEQFFTPTVVKFYQEQEQREQQIRKEERRKSVPARMNTPPPGYLFAGNSPQYNNPLLGGTPRSNPEIKEDTELSFSKIHSSSSRLPKPSDSRRSFENPTLSRSGRHDNLSSSRPNVTLVQPFKSPSLSSSPSQDNLPSPTFSERSSPLHRSPSSLSLQQRSRPLSLSGGGGVTLSSSVKSNSSAGSLPKFSTSFSSYRHERNSGSSGRESVSNRKRSRSSLTNKSDGSTSDRGSFNSSFFASLDPEDDVGEFVRLVDTHEPLKMFSRSLAGSAGLDDSGNPGIHMLPKFTSLTSKLQPLQRFQKYKESHNTLSDSISSLTIHSSPQQLEPPSGLGTSSGSVSSSVSSISKSTTHPPNVPSRLSENVTSDKQGGYMISRASSEETRALIPESSSTEMGMVQTDNVIIRNYSSYSDELGAGIRHVDSSTSLSSQQHNQLYNETNSESRDSISNREVNNEIMVKVRRGITEGMNIPKSNAIKDNAFNDGLITDLIAGEGDVTGSPASANSLRVQVEDELLFSLNLSEERGSTGGVNNDTTVKSKEINTLEITTENNQEKIQKMTRIDE